MFELVKVDNGRPARPPAMLGGYRSGVGCPFSGVCSFHLSEKRQHDHGQLRNGGAQVGSVNWKGIGQRPDPDASFFELVDQV